MTSGYGYLRVSGAGQIPGDGFPRQRATIEAYAALHGIEIIRWYEERGVCGESDLAGRPALVELFEDAAERGVKTIMVEALHRFARQLMVQETILADIKKRGWELISAREPDLCRDDPERVMMRQIFGAIAQYEKAQIVAKLRVARERIKARGESCEGRKPYGHYPAEVAGLEIIRECARYGQEPAAVAARLDAAGIPSRSGGRWHPFAVRRIMERLKS